MTTIDDHYKNDPLLRRWDLVRGKPRCVEDAISSDHPDAAFLLTRNAEVRADIEAVEAYESALRLIARVEASEPLAETSPVYDGEGLQISEETNPAFAAYLAAIITRDTATGRTLDLALERSTDELQGAAT
jgi:hypothetical protein